MDCRAGADLREECPVKDAVLDKAAGMWTVTLDDDTTFRARVRYLSLFLTVSFICQLTSLVFLQRNETSKLDFVAC